MKEIDIEQLDYQIDINKSYLFFISPNYEDRSIGFLEEILKLSKKNFRVVVIKLQSHSYKIDILDDLKVNLFNKSVEKLKAAGIDYKVVEITYPDRYTPMKILHLKNDYLKDGDNVIFDISCIPKSVVIHVCEEFLRDEKLSDFSLAYSSPNSYPKIRYPQAIGEMKGVLNHESINKLIDKHVQGTLITFPSDLGYSGQLIADQVARYNNFEQYLFVYMRRREPMSSYNAIAGNINLLGEAYKEWRNNVVNHFSIQDGFRKLEDVVNHIIDRVKQSERARYLVLFAPFGPKPLIAGCYLLCQRLREAGFSCEIVQESSFQYSSVYSLGLNKTYLFKIK